MASKPDLNAVSSKTELGRFFDDLQFLKKASETRLDTLSAAYTPSRSCGDINALISKLHSASESSRQLSNIVSESSSITQESRIKIEKSLYLYTRAKEARELVEKVTELRQCIQGIESAMEMKEWVRAAQIMQTSLTIPESVYTSEFACKAVPTIHQPAPPLKTVQQFSDELGRIFSREFDKAARNKDMTLLTHYFKLFPQVNKRDLGLERYADFICGIIAGMSRNLLHSDQQQVPNFYAIAFSKLMENIASIINQHASIVSRHFGETAMPETVIPIIQHEVDKQAGLIIDTFYDERRIEQLTRSCKDYSYPQLVQTFIPASNAASDDQRSDLDLAETSNRLSEISTMMNRWSLYTHFLGRWHVPSKEDESAEGHETSARNDGKDDGNSKSSHKNSEIQEEPKNEGKQEKQGKPHTFYTNATQAKIDALLSPAFTTLSLFVFRRSMERAVVADELPTAEALDAHQVFSVESPLVSSLVDDVLYVFSNVLGQTVDCEDTKTINASFAGLKRVLESDLVGTLQRKLRQTAAADSANSSDAANPVIPFAVYLNDVEITAVYVSKAVDNILAEKHQSTGLQTQLNAFKQSLRKKTTDLIQDGCVTLVSIRVNTQVRGIMSRVFKQSTYTGDSDYSRNGVAFELQFKRFLKPFLQLLHPTVLVEMVSLTCKMIADTMEKFVWSLEGKVNAKQAIMLEKDLSHLEAVCTETSYSLKRYFVRLLQMVNVIIDGENAESSKLTSDEVRRLARFIR